MAKFQVHKLLFEMEQVTEQMHTNAVYADSLEQVDCVWTMFNIGQLFALFS